MTLNINFISDLSVMQVLEKFIGLRQGYFVIFIACAKLSCSQQLITWYYENKHLEFFYCWKLEVILWLALKYEKKKLQN